MKYRLIMFDLDGTLIDTMAGLAASVNYTLEHFGYERKSIADIQKNVGYGIAYMIRNTFPVPLDDNQLEEILSVYMPHYNSTMNDVSVPYPGITELLKRLKDAGVRLVVSTNKYHTAAQSMVSHCFGDLFDEVIGDGAGYRRKPDPEVVYAMMEKYGTDKTNSLYAGDSEADIATARNAGIDCIAVTWGLRDRAELEKLGPTYMTDSADRFIETIEQGE